MLVDFVLYVSIVTIVSTVGRSIDRWIDKWRGRAVSMPRAAYDASFSKLVSFVLLFATLDALGIR